MIQKELTTKRFWEERHKRESLKVIYPRPNLYYLDFELDLIFSKFLHDSRGKTILEMGCGNSVWLPYFKKKFGHEISGVDDSPSGLSKSIEILKRNRVEGRLVQKDFFELGESYRSAFDVVFSLGVIEHFKDPFSVLTLFKDCLRTGGFLITWVPNTSGWVLMLNRFLSLSREKIHHEIDLKTLVGYHRSAGLEVLAGHYTQFADLTLLNLLRLPPFWQKWLSRLFRGFSLPMIWLGKYSRIHLRNGKLCSGIIVVGKKT